MAKGDQEKTMAEIQAQQRRSQTGWDTFQGRTQNDIGSESGAGKLGYGTKGRIEQQRNDLNSRFGNYAGTGGINDNARRALEDSPQSIAGRIQTPNYGDAYEGYRNLASTGGMNIANATDTFRGMQAGNEDMRSAASGLRNINFGDVNDTISRLKDFGATGGFTAADKENILRPLYYENEKTGGYSDRNLADIKKESNSTISSMYGNMQDEMNRRRAASGYGAGFGANAQSMARQGAIEGGNQSLRTNIGLAESVRQGKMSAADAIQRGQLGISDISGRNTLGAYGSAGSLGLGVTGQQASNLEASGDMTAKMEQLRLAAAQGDVNAQRMLQEGKISGLGGMTDIRSREGNFDLNRADLASGNVRSLQGMEQQGQQYGMSGLAGMYGADMGRLSDEQHQQLNALGMNDEQQARLLDIRMRNAAQPGKHQQAYGNVLSGMGAVSGLLTGIGGMR